MLIMKSTNGKKNSQLFNSQLISSTHSKFGLTDR